jgi:hypothetical protein
VRYTRPSAVAQRHIGAACWSVTARLYNLKRPKSQFYSALCALCMIGITASWWSLHSLGIIVLGTWHRSAHRPFLCPSPPVSGCPSPLWAVETASDRAGERTHPDRAISAYIANGNKKRANVTPLPLACRASFCGCRKQYRPGCVAKNLSPSNGWANPIKERALFVRRASQWVAAGLGSYCRSCGHSVMCAPFAVFCPVGVLLLVPSCPLPR